MKTTNKNSFVHKTAAWISKHRYGFLQTVFFILTAFSLLWMYFYGEPENPDGRGLWTKPEGYFLALYLAFFNSGLFGSDAEMKFRAFNCAVLFGYLLALVWCGYWAISYVFPTGAAALITVFYRKIRPEDCWTSYGRLIFFSCIVWVSAAIVPIAYTRYEDYFEDYLKKDQEYTRQAKETPVIKVVDSKDDYIYTEEYGLEQISSSQDIPKGSMIHRLPTKDGKVFVVAE